MCVSLTPDGFTVRETEISWSTVRSIVTYKRDLWAYDDIRLVFEISDEVCVEVSEEDAGFKALVVEVERRFPEVPGDWFHTVMFPAFEENYRVLWTRTEHEQET